MAEDMSPEQTLVSAKFVATGFVAGVVIFAAVVLIIGPSERDPMVAYLAAAIAAAALLTHRPIGTIVGRQAKGPVQGRFLTRTLVTFAVLEGPALFNIVALLLEGQLLSLGMATLLVGAMLLAFPTHGKLDQFTAKASQGTN
ncbi:MAG: hypothetical protein AAF561_08910 [Planctomycetota bacterium]